MLRRFIPVVCLLIAGVACGAQPGAVRTSVGTGADQIPVVVVKGTPYEMGEMYGRAMAGEIKAVLPAYLSGCQAEDPKARSDAALDKAWETVEPYVHSRFIEEMKGLATGAGIDYATVRRAHSMSLLMDHTCSGVAVWGKATANGHLYQIRNMDFITEMGLQNYPVIVVYLPKTGVPHANVGFAGYVGSVAGINAEGIVLMSGGLWPGGPCDLRGVPFYVLFRNILQDAHSLAEAKRIISDAKRHKSYHYIVGDGDEPGAVKVRIDAPGFRMWTDNDPQDELYPNVMPNAVYRTMNNRLAWQHLKDNYGQYDATRMIELSRLVKMRGSNLMNIVYDATAREMWIAYAEGNEEAAERQYVHFDLKDYLPPKDGR